MPCQPQIQFLFRDSRVCERHLTLRAQEIIIVAIKSDDFLNNVDDLHCLLSPEEKEHVKKIPLLDVRHRYIIQKAWLRLLLSELLDIPTDAIEFASGQYGKPSLKNPSPDGVINFNISHTDHYVLYAFAKNFQVGIDVENSVVTSGSMLNAISLATTPSEKKALDELLPTEQLAAFLHLWTKKEAISKVLGLGLNMDFSNLEIGINENPSCTFMSSQNITLVDISRPALFFASLAFIQI